MKKLFFLGAGKMATAIASGVTVSKMMAADELVAYDVAEAACTLTFKRSTSAVFFFRLVEMT